MQPLVPRVTLQRIGFLTELSLEYGHSPSLPPPSLDIGHTVVCNHTSDASQRKVHIGKHSPY